MLHFFKKYTLFLSLQLLLLCFIFVSFCIEAFSFIDYDFGWHLQLGKYILLSGIPKTDPFSYTMSNYPLIDHEWLTNIFFAKIYPFIGFYGLSTLFCIIALLPFIVVVLRYRSKITFSLLLLLAGSLIDFVGIRPKLFDWVFAAIFFLLFSSSKLWTKYRYISPVIMLLWVNIHGGFAIGIFFLLLYIVSKAVQEKQVNKQDILVLFTSLFATCINPYGITVWRVVWDSLGDPQLHTRILEWMPSFTFLNLFLCCYITLSLVFFIKYIKHLSVHQRVFYIVLFCLGISVYRHMPFWLLYSLPITIQTIRLFVKDTRTIPFGQKRLSIVYVLFLLLIGSLWIITYWQLLPLKKPDAFYPTKAIAYLRAHPFSGQLFAPYEWGGYLIWQYPQKKVFIDGLMPSWRWHSPDTTQSNDAFTEYEQTINGTTSFSSLLSRYHISRILFFKALADVPSQRVRSRIQAAPQWLIHYNDAPQKLVSQLQASGMHLIYKDAVSVIYGK